MKAGIVRPVAVEAIPDRLEEGVLYVCDRYRIAIHKCCCGCGEEVVTPLNEAEWSLTREGGAVTLYPSIGNWSFACQSHYWIRRNRVVWSTQMSTRQIQRVKAKDRADKETFARTSNDAKREQMHEPRFWQWLIEKIRSWF